MLPRKGIRKAFDLRSLPNATKQNARVGNSYECNELELDTESLPGSQIELAVKNMHEFKFGENKEEKVNKFLDEAASYFHHQNFVPTGVFSTIGKIENHLNKLNENLVAANNSSEKLTEALNRITFWGVVIAGAGVILATISLWFEIYQSITTS